MKLRFQRKELILKDYKESVEKKCLKALGPKPNKL